MKPNYNRISRRMVDAYCRARKNGFTSVTLKTRVVDYNALAIAIKARAPKVVVYYECLTKKVKLEQR